MLVSKNSSCSTVGSAPAARRGSKQRATNELEWARMECPLRNQFLHYVPINIGQPEIPAGEPAMIYFNVVVVVPRLAVAMPDLNKSNAAFEQPASHQKLACLCAGTVQIANMFGLLFDVEGLGGLGLHSVREFKRFDPGLEL